MTPVPLDEADLRHLRCCVALAREALDAGDDPFGSLLVDGRGVVRREERNRAGAGDETQHPELALAQWSASLSAEERAAATVYTSGEHCPMCSAAHAWMGLGRLVYAGSAAQLAGWREGWGLPGGPVRVLAVGDVAPGVVTDGPAPELEAELRDLHHRAATRTTTPPPDDVPPTARRLALEPHPEGGWYRQTWRSPVTVSLPDGRDRPTATVIWFLLPAGVASAWHRVASDEVWLAHDGTVRLQLGGDGESPDDDGAVHVVGTGAGEQPEVVVPAGHWQRTLPGEHEALVRCLVSPGFDFADFDLAPG